MDRFFEFVNVTFPDEVAEMIITAINTFLACVKDFVCGLLGDLFA